MTEKPIADELRDLVFKKFNITNPTDLQCPREQSAWTPCVARDGDLAAADEEATICVGCEAKIQDLLDKIKIQP